MLNEPVDSQKLIESFLNAVRLRQLEQCQKLLVSLEALADQQISLKPWCLYLQGVLAFEVRYDWAEAEQIFIHLLQTELEPTLRERVLYSFGRSLNMQGRWTEAMTAFEQIIEFGQPIGKAKAWNHIAATLYAGFIQGDFGAEVLARAITCGQAALGILELIQDSSPDAAWFKSSTWNTLGLIHVSLGEWDEAINCYQRDLTICEAINDRHGMGPTYGNLGEVYQKQGNWSDALAAYQQALAIFREFDNRYDEIEALANVSFLYQEMGQIELALEHYGQAIQLIEDLRAGVSAEAAQAGFFATVLDTYANMALLCLNTNRPEQAFNIVEQARSRAFVDSLAARSPQLAEQIQQQERAEATTMTLTEVQTALPADALLLEYFTTGLLEAVEKRAASQNMQRHRFPPAQTWVFAVTPEGVRAHNTGLSPNDLRPHRLNNVVERHFLRPQIRRTLYNQLIGPVEGLLPGKRRLYIVPHGPLHYIPFQALLAPNGENLLREDGPQLIYAPSATLLFRYGRREPNQAPASCLALGYNGEGASRLRFAEEEARSVAQLTNGHALIGPSANKAELYRRAADYRLLHFSCHGEFDPEMPLASALHLGPGETLTALDVLDHLHLRCDLVTLSACESGLSRVRRGDELVGLTRAFMYAGAPALISTLWRVDERSTRILMEKFYQAVQQGASFAEALKQAQLYLKQLTHQEALAILASPPTSANTSPELNPIADTTSSPLPPIGVLRQQTRTYLKGMKRDSPPTQSDELDAEAKIFADPFYWAPFVLVGDYESEWQKEEAGKAKREVGWM